MHTAIEQLLERSGAVLLGAVDPGWFPLGTLKGELDFHLSLREELSEIGGARRWQHMVDFLRSEVQKRHPMRAGPFATRHRPLLPLKRPAQHPRSGEHEPAISQPWSGGASSAPSRTAASLVFPEAFPLAIQGGAASQEPSPCPIETLADRILLSLDQTAPAARRSTTHPRAQSSLNSEQQSH